jgi:hypothetical protein
MRQSQQKNRMRGRGRKGPNPMSRTYESNGPDVKIRGTATHVAEKYATLARDALAMGDNVMAENYLQHAEHYNRIIAAAAAQQASRNEENAAANYGRGPQPELSTASDQDNEDDSGEERAATAGSERSRAAAQTDESEETVQAEASERRPRGDGRNRRRPRRESTNDSSQESGREEGDKAAGANGANGAHAANGNGAEKAKRDISSDASMLPESILGSGPAGQEANAEE